MSGAVVSTNSPSVARVPRPDPPRPSPAPEVQPVARANESTLATKPASEPMTSAESMGSGDVVVVARSSMNVDSENVTKTLSPDIPEPEPIAPVVTEPVEKKEKVSRPAINKLPKFGSLGPASRTVRILSWLLAFPTAFFIVVILPRLFGMGFHASDFVDVITMQGIGRYKIVVVLIFLWSITTVIFVSIYSFAIQWIMNKRHSSAPSV